MPTLRERVAPPSHLAGRLSVQSISFAIGEGTFLTSSAVFFTQIVGLSAAQVGLGITIAGVASFLIAVPAGRLADRVGPQRLWAFSALGGAALYATWPFIDGFTAFLVVSVLIAIVGDTGGAAYGAYTIDVLPLHERVTSRAYMYSALNLGFTLGAGLGGIALALNDDRIIQSLPWLVAVLGVVNAFYIHRLPAAAHARSAAPPLEQALEAALEAAGDPSQEPGHEPEHESRPPAAPPGALRNRGFVAASFCRGVLTTNQVLLQIVIPLWLVEQTDAPRVLLAWLFGTNTVLCILLPTMAARGVHDVATALRAARYSSVFFVASCLITLVTHETIGLLTIALVWLGHVTVTGAEIYLSAASWAMESGLSDPDRRGEYQGADNLGRTLGYVWAPALYTFLAISWGPQGWLVIAAIVGIAVVALHPSTRAAERFLVRWEIDPTR